MVTGGGLGCEPRRGGARGGGAVVARKMETLMKTFLAWSIPKDLLVLRLTGNPLHPTCPIWCGTVGLLGRTMPLLLGEHVQGGTGCAVFPPHPTKTLGGLVDPAPDIRRAPALSTTHSISHPRLDLGCSRAER